MCGIAGFLDLKRATDAAGLETVVAAMTDAIAHRGPDDAGRWVDAEAGLALGQRRLAIVDLSPAGHQPMFSASGRLVIVYNGEVYNFQDLRAELEAGGHRFRGSSDTEVILEACERGGIAETVSRLIGMFAMAIYDRETGDLHLVRDRLGIKPLYLARFGDTLLFGSELKALRAHPAFAGTVNRDALAAYLRFAYVPAPMSIWQGVEKLGAGTILTIRRDGTERRETFWSMAGVARAGLAGRLDISDDEAVARLDALLGDAVRRRMVADVPLGALLSGGIDSSTVAALMQASSDRPVRTFSIGFGEAGYDESAHAAAVARHLGTNHTELKVTARDALDLVPRLPQIYDEPFADSSQIPTFLVSELTRRHVTVALSGDGGDELFAGYNRHLFAATLWPRLAGVPRPLRRLAAAALAGPAPAAWDRFFAMLPRALARPQAGDKLAKLARVLGEDFAGAYRRLVSQWDDPAALLRAGSEPNGPVFDESIAALVADPVERMQYLDTVTYLPDDILAKVDRASMAVALEVRVPIIDHRVVEFAWALPARFRIRDGETKWLLRRVLDRYVPRDLVERPKMGFAIPLEAWLRGPLRDWAEALLDERRLREEGYFDPAPIRARWAEHLSGARNRQHELWVILMFQAWLEANRPA